MSPLGVAALVTALAIALIAIAFVLFLRMLARRVVGVTPRRKPLTVSREGDTVVLPRSVETEAPGHYGLWFGEGFTEHAVVGDVLSTASSTVTRRVAGLGVTSTAPFLALWTGHTLAGPAALGIPWQNVSVPLADGTAAPAWFFPAESERAPWAVHVQGIRTSRLVTLRAVEAAQRAGYASLVITYRSAGDGPPAEASALGLSEWADLRDAVEYARSSGATEVTVMAWSMGAGLALELARRDPEAVDSLILICPATNWRRIVRHGAEKAHLPSFVGAAAIAFLASPLLSRLVGLLRPIDFDALDWSRSDALTVPTLVIHSAGDDEIPVELSREFAEAHHELVTLVETKSAPHGWEPNVDPEGFADAISSWFTRIQN